MTDQELTDAAEELKKLAPEAYLEMLSYISSLEKQITLPEAGGVAFVDSIYTQGGVQVHLVGRGVDTKAAAVNLHDGIQFVIRKYGWSTSQSAVKKPDESPTTARSENYYQSEAEKKPEPSYVPDAANAPVSASTVTINVVKFKIDTTKAGVHYLRVFGGNYSKFGVPAYPEVVPSAFDITKYNVGVEDTNPPACISRAVIANEKPLKVIGFNP